MMGNNSKFGLMALVLAVLIIVGVALLPQQPGVVQAAPAAAPTPVSVTRPANSAGYITFNPFTDAKLTADTGSTCFDVANYSVIDALFVVDQRVTNAITLTTRWGIDSTNLVNGVNIVAARSTDGSDMQQVQVFGRYFCVLAEVSNANPGDCQVGEL